MEVYRIKNWSGHFENKESRKLVNLRYVLVPNKHDGKGYRRITLVPDGLKIFGAFILILEIASKAPTRGVLADEDGPLTISDIAAMTGFKEEDFSKAMEVLTSKQIGWIETINLPDEGEIPPPKGEKVPLIEGKGREYKEGIEGKGEPAHFPSVQEVVEFGKGAAAIPEAYCRDYHAKKDEAHGWIKNGQLIQWKKEIVRWFNGDRHKYTSKNPPPSTPDQHSSKW